ncbi:PEP-CTERM sorting domain-containing protein, partial [Streptomyces sp. NPDC058394]
MTTDLGPFAPTRQWMRTHPLATDAVLAFGAFVAMVLGSFADPHGPHGPTFGTRTPEPFSLLLMLLGAAALVFRRRQPRAVLAVTCGLSLLELTTGEPRAPVAMCTVIALYTVAS